jgi:tRNA G46 methylase TrmB
MSESNTGKGDSRRVQSNQSGVHPRLLERVRRHAQTPWQQPLHAPSEQAFEQVDALRREQGETRPLVLDSGCGTGVSALALAELHPRSIIIAIDQSASRLARVGAERAPRREGRVIWARAEAETVWRLALGEGWPVARHYLLYPNPWPKSAHLGRRWHGHPVFPTLLALGGTLELRCNWQLYAEEFSLAVGAMRGAAPPVQRFHASSAAALTPFEAKYHASGHALWRVTT